MNELKYRLADKFFEKELDEAYEMGLREGIRHSCQILTFDMGIKLAGLPKNQQSTWKKALAMIAEFYKNNGGR